MTRLWRLGPGFLVTAAFIGPGTLTTATKAGAHFGFALGWAILFSILATITLQEMAARLGLVARIGLGEAIQSTFKHPILRWAAIGLILGAIGFGNAAFEFGNLTGAGLGWSAVTGWDVRLGALLTGVLAFGCLFLGRYRVLEVVLIALVALMSGVFLITAIRSGPDFESMVKDVFTPIIPDGALLTVIALIGTTVVPYNLFLQASLVRAKWSESIPTRQALAESRFDTASAVTLGGLVTLSIMATAAAAFFAKGKPVGDAAAMAEQLGPTLGPASRHLFGLGLFAAGLTSAITAPLAAAYATAGALGWGTDLRSTRFRMVWGIVLFAGLAAALAGYKPVDGIILAQAFNGVLLPAVAIFLLIAVNRRSLMGEHRNGWVANLVGVGVVLVAAGLGLVTLAKVAGFIQ